MFIHVDPKIITMGCPNPVQGAQIKFESTLRWGILGLCSQGHMNERTLLNNVMTANKEHNLCKVSIYIFSKVG